MSDQRGESPLPSLDSELPSSDETAGPNWQKMANCLGVDPDMFFPERGANAQAAKEICRACVVRVECLEFALENGEQGGIWGGYTDRERRRIKRTRAVGHIIGDGN